MVLSVFAPPPGGGTLRGSSGSCPPKTKGRHAAEVHGKQILAGSAPGPAAAPFFGSGKLEHYLARRRPGLQVRGADTFEPVANLHRCYLRQDPVFLRFLARLVGRDVDRHFYFRRLLPGALRGPAGSRAACAYALLRDSFLGTSHGSSSHCP